MNEFLQHGHKVFLFVMANDPDVSGSNKVLRRVPKQVKIVYSHMCHTFQDDGGGRWSVVAGRGSDMS